MTIPKLETMVPDAQGRMLQQMQYKPGMMEAQRLLIEPLQEAEEQAHKLMHAYSIENAEGELLEFIGVLHGQPRPQSGLAATSDNAYRVLIYGRIAANNSTGTIPDLYNVLLALKLGDPKIFEDARTHLTVNYINNSLTLTCRCVSHILRQAKLPVSMTVTEHTDTPFGYEGDFSAYGYDIGQIGDNP